MGKDKWRDQRAFTPDGASTTDERRKIESKALLCNNTQRPTSSLEGIEKSIGRGGRGGGGGRGKGENMRREHK